MKNLFTALLVLLSITINAQNRTGLTAITRTGSTQNLDSYFDPALKPFYHGVASGDPLQNRVIIWTRVTPESDGTIPVSWRVATDPNMTNVVNNGVYYTDASKDYTVKVDVGGLLSATTYYYDFNALGATSITGRTRTAPEGDINQLRFAVVSCSNYQDGYFNAYERISERNDIDALIHLGDYIYEYEAGGYGYSEDVNRGHIPENEIISLMDYRIRYSYYRLDPQLRKAHQQLPFITIWDDHEFANNAYMDGAENHQSNEGEWNARKNNAYQAYFEWMPIRSTEDPNRIYRKINYGNLMDLILLDTRVEGREKQEDSLIGKRKAGLRTEADFEMYLEQIMPNSVKGNLSSEEYQYLLDIISKWGVEDKGISKLSELENDEEFIKAKALIEKAYQAEGRTSNHSNTKQAASRQLLSETQFSWFENNLKNSNAQWKVVANQVLLMPLRGLGLTDTWDGYADSRERLLDYIKSNDIDNVVMLTGDIHMTFAGDLPTSFWSYTFNKKNSAAVEFVAPSISSGNLDELVGISDGFLTRLLGLFNPHIKNADLNEHGYFLLTVNGQKAQADWYYVDDVKTITTGQSNGESWYVNSGDTRLKEASGPIQSSNAYNVSAPSLPSVSATGFEKGNIMVIGNYPNPADAFTTIHYGLSEKSNVKIELRDSKGQLAKEVLNQEQEANLYALTLDTEDLKPGVYIYTVTTGKEQITRRLVIK
ncbi:T9SS type A sorting domain-containing protein [Fulvivirga sp. RKSG066]|uniref:alkaline phosphatase D family protein n=1 Tax=Fulvivirga aurantia TaxID=2529383 RepID=UPI0012BC3EDA|nr:alkaline phosphatase D family protein [Fulvivirga aurantia]MTI21611.1 T9SS type A sorting domain-containing protein [Fulvivirga aurantia]